MGTILTVIIRGAGGVTILLGIGILAGWFVVPLTPEGTTSGFFLSPFVAGELLLLRATGLWACERGWSRLSLLRCGLVVVISSSALMLSGLDSTVGVASLFGSNGFLGAFPFHEQFGPYALGSFLLIAVALLLQTLHGKPPWVSPLIGLLGAALTVTGILTFWSDGGEPASRAADACGFTLLGVGIFSLAWRQDARVHSGIPFWLTDLVSVTVLTVALLLWQELRAQEQKRLHIG